MKLEGRRKNLLEMCGRHPTKKTGGGKGNDILGVHASA